MNNINTLRAEIDTLDNELIDILSRRFEVTRKIGLYKKINKLNSVDWKRSLKRGMWIKRSFGTLF
jgi:chorismate mutase